MKIIYEVWYDKESDQQSSDIKEFNTLEEAKRFCKRIEKRVARFQIEASKKEFNAKTGEWEEVARKTYAPVDDDPSGWYEYDWVRENWR